MIPTTFAFRMHSRGSKGHVVLTRSINTYCVPKDGDSIEIAGKKLVVREITWGLCLDGLTCVVELSPSVCGEDVFSARLEQAKNEGWTVLENNGIET